MSELADRTCRPCRDGTPPLDRAEAERLLVPLQGWCLIDGKRLTKRYGFTDFRGALAFANAVGEVAESENHHPDIALGWGYATLDIWTHAAGGLTENDFILAAKAERLYAAVPGPARSSGR